MQVFCKFTFVFLFSLIILDSSYAKENIAFINIDFLIKNSNIGKKKLNEIKDLDNNNIKNLEKKNKILSELENSIKNKRNIISDEELRNEIKNFQKKVNSFNNEKNILVNKFNNYKKEELDKIFEKFNPIIMNYMKINELDILFDSKNIFMGDESLNITKDVLKIINSEIE